MSTLDFKDKALAAFLAVASIAPLTLAPTQPAFAQGTAAEQLSVQATPEAEALDRAYAAAEEFANKTGGVGVVILYGAGPDISPVEEFEAGLKAAFAKRGLISDYFVVTDTTPGISMSYHIPGGIAVGPFPPTDAGKEMKTVEKLLEGRKRVLSEHTRKP